MKNSILSSVKNALSSYVELTISSPIKDISHHSPLQKRSPKEAKPFSMRKTISEQLQHRSPKCDISVSPHSVSSHYVGELDTAAKYSYRGQYLH